jgi:MFS family permease
MAVAGPHSNRKYRLAAGALFFLLGLCFSSWASRIPTIQQQLQLNDTRLGMVLFALPSGSLLSLPLSGWLIDKKGSRAVVITAILLYGLVLCSIGFWDTTLQVAISLFLFGMVGNTVNVSVNTQAVGVEALYNRSIMASFHGLWSLAGFTGALIGTFMIGSGINPLFHFVAIAAITVLSVTVIYPYTLHQDDNRKTKGPLFARPEKSLINLGLIAFCSMLCEGAMFDWSGIYFQKVVGAEKARIGAGFAAFMLTMTTGRFIADWFTNKYGLKTTLQCSGALLSAGLLLAVAFPFFSTAISGFLLVGFGVSSVVPMVYSAAGKSKNLSTGVALAAVSTIGFFGFLLGPPLIGFIAGISSLRISFGVISLLGITIMVIAAKKEI